jgi:parallel beta-helix repeat protein
MAAPSQVAGTGSSSRPPAGRGPGGRRLLRLALGLPLTALGLIAPSTAASATESATVHVSPHGSDSSWCGSSRHPCRTVTAGIARAQAADTVDIAPGTYAEQVVVPKRLHLEGSDAVIDASGLSSGTGPDLNAAALLVTRDAGWADIEGLTVRGAFGEGILVQGAAHVRVRGTTVTGNDLGTPATTTYAECQAQGEEPGDCGEGLHLMGATDAVVENNVVTGNSGGILVTDELGPATRNSIMGNRVTGNRPDCGITLPSHNPDALSATGQRQPDKGGVFENLVRDNTVVGNGLQGAGAGVLIAAAGPGMAAYDNWIIDNRIHGNGMPGVTIHSHTPDQDVSDNVIKDNDIGRNNLNGDPDAGVMVTTGILVYSAVVPVSETVAHNDITGNQKRIWTSPNVTLH